MSDDEEVDVTYWPNCRVLGCPNKCCLALNSWFCFPHTKGNEHVKRMKIAALHGIDLTRRLEIKD